jgi:hypothetical protein
MGVIVHDPFPFPNMMPLANTYIAIGTCKVDMKLSFDSQGQRLYTIHVPYNHWINVDAFYQLLEPLYVGNVVLQANTVVMHDLSKFVHDSLGYQLYMKGMRNFEDDGLTN